MMQKIVQMIIFIIEFTPKSKTIDDIYTNKIIKIDIDYVLALDETKN